MPGVTKHIYEHEINDILKMWKTQLKSILLVLPKHYTESDLISTPKYYYPHEWNSVEYKYSYYQQKDKFLKKRFGKTRFRMSKPEILIKKVQLFIKVLSPEYIKHYSDTFSEKIYLEKKESL